MRRIADLHAGEAKTDARDAAIIAEAARTLPHPPSYLCLLGQSVIHKVLECKWICYLIYSIRFIIILSCNESVV